MKNRAIISTHHKTGCAWMTQTFRGIAKLLEIPADDYLDRGSRDADFSAPHIINDKHGRWYRETRRRSLEKLPDDRVFHLIRDPRDVIISGMHYHRQSRENWLHQKSDEFDGMTYQEKINSLPDDRARYIFEMDNRGAQTMTLISTWPYGRPESFECKYEALIEDTETTLFSAALTHLGFADDDLKTCREEFWRRSLFGGKKEPETRRAKDEIHVRSGKSKQWSDVFDRALSEAFVERWPGLLAKLGYEPDDSWAQASARETVAA